jgi:outer membrane protein TolC
MFDLTELIELCDESALDAALLAASKDFAYNCAIDSRLAFNQAAIVDFRETFAEAVEAYNSGISDMYVKIVDAHRDYFAERVPSIYAMWCEGFICNRDLCHKTVDTILGGN